jgi:hypothetical protein
VVLVDETWDNTVSDHFYVTLTLEGDDAAAFKVGDAAATVTILGADTVLDYTVTGAFTPASNKIKKWSVEGLSVTTDGPGNVFVVVLPASRDVPTAQEILDYYNGEYEYTEEEVNASRALQDGDEADESDEEEEEEEGNTTDPTDNEFEEDTASAHDEFLADWYAAGKLTCLLATTKTFSVDDMWAGEPYKVYATLQMTNGQLSAVAASDLDSDFTTNKAPADKAMGVVLSGEKPGKDKLGKIADALGNTIGVSGKQIKTNEDWVYSKTRMRALQTGEWEVIVLVQSDPSGKSTIDPSTVVALFNTDECASCLDSFQAELNKQLEGEYVSKNFGLESTNTKSFAAAQVITPVFTTELYVELDTVIGLYTETTGTAGDLLYMTVVKGDTLSKKDLTTAQITGGLNHNNLPAAGATVNAFGPDMVAFALIDGLSANSTYTVYSVALN